jgi:hypothetical protein
MYLFSRYTATKYEVKPPGVRPLWVNVGNISETANLKIYYEGSVLYIYINKETFPEIFLNINEIVILPHVKQYGGTPIDDTPRVLDLGLLPWLKRQFTTQSIHELFLKALKEGNVSDSPLLAAQSQTASRVSDIHLDSEVDTINTTSEEVSVPHGVTIKVKRSRTMEHTVDIDWNTIGGVNIETGLKPIISASIRGEIGYRHGRTYKESETLEYEVALNGETSTRYRLSWTDTWRKGIAEIPIGNETKVIPFRFRESTKLEVTPI